MPVFLSIFGHSRGDESSVHCFVVPMMAANNNFVTSPLVMEEAMLRVLQDPRPVIGSDRSRDHWIHFNTGGDWHVMI